MKGGILTWAAIPWLLFVTPALIGAMLWAPQIVPAVVWAPVVVAMVALSVWDGAKSCRFREHARDMAPWAATFVGIAAVVGAVR